MLSYFRAWRRPHDDMVIAKGGLGPWGSSPIEFQRKLLRIETITTAEFTVPLPGWQCMALSVMAAEIFIWGYSTGGLGNGRPPQGARSEAPVRNGALYRYCLQMFDC